MRKYLLTAAVAAAAIATPAAARDGSGYVGVDLGVLFPQDNDADLLADFTTTNANVPPGGTLPPGIPAGPADVRFGNTFGISYKTGYDVDLVGGYDFGMFRLEGEVAYKHAKLDKLKVDNTDIAAINAALNRPSAAPDPGAPGLAPLDSTDFDLNGHVSVLSGMLNGLVDFGGNGGIGASLGGGVGYAR